MVNANIFTEMEKRAKKERLLFAATRDFTAGLDTSAVLHAIVHHMVVALEVDGCTVSRWDPENDCVVTLIDHNTDNEVHCTFPGDTYALSEYPATRFVLKSGNSLTVNIDDPLIDPAEKSFLERYGNESLLMLPLRVGRGKPTFGIIELFRKPGASPFLENDLELAQSLSSQAAIAMENALLYEETQRMAIEDELTHLYNRRGFFELGRRELERAERFGHPMSVLFLDIDFFKQFNDLHSYAVGDQVLRLLANCLHANLREVDVVGRYGGEEFAILLPESDVQAAITVAERIRGAVEAIRVKTDQGEVGFTISIGICQRTPEMPDLDSIIEAAGIALHGAKKTGRNRVEIYLSGDQENSLTQGFGALIHIHSHQKDNTYVSFPPKNT